MRLKHPEILRAAYKAKGYSGRKFATAMGLSQSSKLSLIESGGRAVSLVDGLRMAALLGWSVKELGALYDIELPGPLPAAEPRLRDYLAAIVLELQHLNGTVGKPGERLKCAHDWVVNPQYGFERCSKCGALA